MLFPEKYVIAILKTPIGLLREEEVNKGGTDWWRPLIRPHEDEINNASPVPEISGYREVIKQEESSASSMANNQSSKQVGELLDDKQ